MPLRFSQETSLPTSVTRRFCQVPATLLEKFPSHGSGVLSLKKTCRKLGISFWRYLLDRISGANSVPQLSDLVRQRAQEAHST